jgi:hypothetical protein
MAQNNLRLIYQNIADSSTLATSSVAGSGTPVSNLTKDPKSLVFRSASSGTTSIKLNIVLTFTSKTLGGASSGIGLILANTNLTSAATIRIRGFTGTAPTTGTGTNPTATTPGTTMFDSGSTPILCNPYQSIGLSNWNTDDFYTVTSSTTTYTDRKVYSRVWVPINTPVTCTSVLVEIIDTNINQYIEASRIIFGNYWSPKYNTSYGMSAGTTDLSTSVRTEAGDLITSNAPKFNTLSFDLKWLTSSDRAVLNKVVRLLGAQKPLFVSLFPDNSADWEKEQLYQIYGKIPNIPGIDHSIFEMYSSQLELEEV